MRLTLLGTGAAAGWPSPFCDCASCGWARRTGVARAQTAALLEDDLLLDCGADVPYAAARLGRSLAGVRHLLLTHAHPDHTAPAALLWRSWAGRSEPLDVVGPPAAIELCQDWVGPADPVRFTPAAPGDHLTLGRYDVRALAADHPDGALLWEVDRRLLYATDTGPLPVETLDAVTGAAYDVVLLELTGIRAGDHLDEATFAAQLAELRRRGTVTAATRVVAVHLGDANPPGPELHRRLGLYGAQALPDGSVVEVGAPAARIDPPRRVLVLGGARSGKSVEAERRLAAEPAVTYVATGLVDGDQEWAARVAAHRARRPAAWRTVETADLVPLLRDPPGPLLVDCLTLWLTAHLDDPAAVDALVAAWRATPARVVAVSNEVGGGVVPDTVSGRRFRDALGTLNARIAAGSDEVWLLTAGIPRRLA